MSLRIEFLSAGQIAVRPVAPGDELGEDTLDPGNRGLALEASEFMVVLEGAEADLAELGRRVVKALGLPPAPPAALTKYQLSVMLNALDDAVYHREPGDLCADCIDLAGPLCDDHRMDEEKRAEYLDLAEEITEIVHAKRIS